MSYPNGQLPDSALAPIVGTNSRLRKDAAAAYNALHAESMRRYGISMALNSGSVGRSYRSYAMQVEAKRVYGANAATPGSSNHGLGINVDLETTQQRWVIDQIGAKYGFSKAWSDASWEWWHITFNPAYVTADLTPFHVVKLGDHGKRVRYIQHCLRVAGIKGVPKKGSEGHGHFWKSTKRAVSQFQQKKGLTPDGQVGPKTWEALVRVSKTKGKKK